MIIRWRLEDSLQKAAVRDLDDIAIDINWHRFGNRFVERLEDELVEAMAKSSDPEAAKYARVLLIQTKRQKDMGNQ